MGLDMYLKAERYLSRYSPPDVELSREITKAFPELTQLAAAPDINGALVDTVCITVGYWRKANQVHRWFVDNVMNSRDDCCDHFVSWEQLDDLRDLCRKVGRSKERAARLLPTGEGPFFGSDQYDEGYFWSLKNTIGILNAALCLPEDWSFKYRASW